MIKKVGILFMFCLIGKITLHAQSRVFKEVSDDIKTVEKGIVQDGNLIGYLVFTELERSSKDSFNYRVAILDENLNDIGKLEFKEEKLELKQIAFENDIICLAYLKSNFIGKKFDNRKDYKETKANANTVILTQFLNLEGKIVNKREWPINIKPTISYNPSLSGYGYGELKQSIQLTTLPKKGFVCFFGDDNKATLSAFGTQGEAIWEKNFPFEKDDKYYLTTTNENVYLLMKKNDLNRPNEGGFTLLCYNSLTGDDGKPYDLIDHKGRSLTAISCMKDPQCGKLCITGIILDKKVDLVTAVKDYTNNTYIGVYTLLFSGGDGNAVKENFSYWNDNSKMPAISHNGNFEGIGYCTYQNSFRDFKGNTYFEGSAIKKSFKVGAFISGILLSPLIVITPFEWLLGGFNKFKTTDGLLIKQDANGALSVAASVALEHGRYRRGLMIYNFMVDNHCGYISNTTEQSNYAIMADGKQTVVYDVQKEKVARTIPVKLNKQVSTAVFPAKEGHLMIATYDKKEKSVSLSIEKI